MMTDLFPPTLDEAYARIAAVRPDEYARTRNNIEGAVTRLSPYITHGFVSVREVLLRVAERHSLHVQHKFVAELGWREYFHHVWQHRGDGILQSLHETVLPESAYAAVMPDDIREARTGVPVIDQAVRTLYKTGYLHNHARLWVASYTVHLRKVHWRAGAGWMLAHLLDGDLASNHLSWQWVAGTGSSKPYLFNAENVARFAPSSWHSEGTVLDTSYEALDIMARREQSVPSGKLRNGSDEPELYTRLPQSDFGQNVDLRGRDVWLVHPWALGDPPSDIAEDCLHIGWWPAEMHAVMPWSAARWEFVSARLSALTSLQLYMSREQLQQVLSAARSVQTMRDLHVRAVMPTIVQQREPLKLFAEVQRPCESFSGWWKQSTRGVKELADLPGLAAG